MSTLKSGSEALNILELVQNDLISQESFVHILSSVLASNLLLFNKLFGTEFISWIDWMLVEDGLKFNSVISNVTQTATEQQIYTLQRASTHEKALSLFHHLNTFLDKCNVYSNFIMEPFLAHRIKIFIDIAVSKVEGW
jgi:hypothetical protein